MPPISKLPPRVGPPAPKSDPPPATPAGPTPRPAEVPGQRDSFEPPRVAGPAKKPATLEELKNALIDQIKKGMVESPEMKKLAPGTKKLMGQALKVTKDPQVLKLLQQQMKSEWFQKLPAAEQEKTLKSLLREALSPREQIDLRYEVTKDLARELRG